MTLYRWSRTAANNANADGTCSFPEGMSPAAVNDGTRGMMAAVAKYRDDLAGAIVTGGTPTAYTVSSFQGFTRLADLDGQEIAFSPHVTNEKGPVTLAVDGMTIPLRTAPGAELVEGTLVQGTPYMATYRNSDGALYLKGFYSSPYNVPFLGGMDYWDTITPNSCFIFPLGQAISRTVYQRAFARWGTKFGAGDGLNTFNVPNKGGKVSAMIEPAATLLTADATGFGADSTQIGSIGGSQSHTLSLGEMPAHSHDVVDPGHSHAINGGYLQGDNGGGGAPTGSSYNRVPEQDGNVRSHTTGVYLRNAGGGNPHTNVQPTITCNYIIRVL
jgi:microcystin-dependent protein